MRSIRLLMVLIIALAVGFIGYFYFDVQSQKSKAKQIDTSGQPTLGSKHSPIHVIVFEEPYCSACRKFSERVLPAIRSEFVDKNLATVTVIPVSFLPHSMLLAEGWLSVYHQNPAEPNAELFFAFARYFYQHQPDEGSVLSVSQVLQMAKEASPKINLQQLEHNLKERTYHIRVEENTTYAKQLLGGRLATPALFINGRVVEDISVNNVMTEIHERLAEFHDRGGDR